MAKAWIITNIETLMHIEHVFNTMSHTSNEPEQALQWTQQAVSQHKFSHCNWQQWMHAYKPSTHKLNLKAAYNRCLKASMWTQKRTSFITAECQATWSRKLANSFKTHTYPDLLWRYTILSHVGLYCLDHVDDVLHVQVKLLNRQQSQHVQCVKQDAFVPE